MFSGDQKNKPCICENENIHTTQKYDDEICVEVVQNIFKNGYFKQCCETLQKRIESSIGKDTVDSSKFVICSLSDGSDLLDDPPGSCASFKIFDLEIKIFFLKAQSQSMPRFVVRFYEHKKLEWLLSPEKEDIKAEIYFAKSDFFEKK